MFALRLPRRNLASRLGACALTACLGYLGIGVVHHLQAPLPAAAATDKRLEGAELFATRGCTHCHGSDGEGGEQGPALRELRKHLSAERITDQIAHGGGAMPAFGDVLQPGEIESLVIFLRAKRWTPAPAPASPAAAAAGNPAAPSP